MRAAALQNVAGLAEGEEEEEARVREAAEALASARDALRSAQSKAAEDAARLDAAMSRVEEENSSSPFCRFWQRQPRRPNWAPLRCLFCLMAQPQDPPLR